MAQQAKGVLTAIKGDLTAYMDFTSVFIPCTYKTYIVVCKLDANNASKGCPVIGITSDGYINTYNYFFRGRTGENSYRLCCELGGQGSSTSRIYEPIGEQSGIYCSWLRSNTAGAIKKIDSDYETLIEGTGVFNSTRNIDLSAIGMRTNIEVEWIKIYDPTNFSESAQPLYDFEPCIQNGEVGFLEIVNNVFYGNVNPDGGSFVAVYR